MNKSKKITLAVLSAVLVVCIVFTALCFNSEFLSKITGSIDVSSASGKSFADFKRGEFVSDYPLVQTPQRDLFYEAYPDGKIKFYTYSDSGFKEKKDIKTQDIKFDSSMQTVKVKIYYTKTESGTVGYGLYTSAQNSDVKLLSYLFVRLADSPDAYKKLAGSTDYMLFADRDAEDAYKTDKTYSDAYFANLSTGKAVGVISNRDRPVQEDGTYRENWMIFTDNGINNMKKYDLFATGRNYDSLSENLTYDIITVANSKSMKKSSATTIAGSPDYRIWEKDGNYNCFVNTDNGFAIIKNGDRKKPVAEFEGSFSDYAVSGEWLLNKATLDFTNIYTGEVTSVKKANFAVFSGFISNSSSNKFIIFCNDGKPAMVMYDTVQNKHEVVADEAIFNSGICNFCYIDDSTFVTASYAEDGRALNNICTF